MEMDEELRSVLEEIEGEISVLSACLSALRATRDRLQKLAIVRIELLNPTLPPKHKGGWKHSPEAKKRISESKKSWHKEMQALRDAYRSQSDGKQSDTDGTKPTTKLDNED